MKKLLVIFLFLLINVHSVGAQTTGLNPSLLVEQADEATESATASGIVEKVVEKKPDLTEPEGEVKTKLEKLLEDNPVKKLSWNNFMRYTIFQAVKDGVPVNTIVLIMLFPLVVTMVTASRHMVGLQGLGILTPSLLAVAFVATGIGSGVLLFAVILVVATLTRMLLRKLKLQYLPRMALLLWFVSLGVFLSFVATSHFNLGSLSTVGIFPILILMLLAETFIDVQVGRSMREAMSLIVTTFGVAFVTSLIIALDSVQRWMLLYPEAIFFGVGLFDLYMGKYVGLRVVEILKFRQVLGENDSEE